MPRLTLEDYSALAAFRYALRKFLRFSRDYLSSVDLTPEQYEALLVLQATREKAVTIGDLSERLQVKHHTAVSLVDRLTRRGVVRRKKTGSDARQVHLQITARGRKIIAETAAVHRAEIRRRCPEMGAVLRRLKK